MKITAYESFSLAIGLISGYILGRSVGYDKGFSELRQEAVEEGHMVRELDPMSDRVIYRWRELHDLGYEDIELPQIEQENTK